MANDMFKVSCEVKELLNPYNKFGVALSLADNVQLIVELSFILQANPIAPYIFK